MSTAFLKENEYFSFLFKIPKLALINILIILPIRRYPFYLAPVFAMSIALKSY